jgi:hypothetical protein
LFCFIGIFVSSSASGSKVNHYGFDIKIVGENLRAWEDFRNLFRLLVSYGKKLESFPLTMSERF